MLSARPKELGGVVKIKQKDEMISAFEAVGDAWNLTSWGINLDSSVYGNLKDEDLNEAEKFMKFGRTQSKEIQSYIKAKPLTKYLFLGDDGQGDACGGESMLRSSGGDSIVGVLVHAVQPQDKETTRCEDTDGITFPLSLRDNTKYMGRAYYHSTDPLEGGV